jgi:hypothetical protein
LFGLSRPASGVIAEHWPRRSVEQERAYTQRTMRRSRFAFPILALLVLVLPQAASAKGLEPVRVVAESGKAGWIRGASARAWWADFDASQPGDCGCASADDAARFMYHLTGRWGSAFNTPDGSWPTAMLVQAPHLIPMLYYPAGGTAPAYLLVPGESGAGGRHWDRFHVVTARMQRIMTAALKKGTVSTYTGGSTAFPAGWAVGGGFGAVLLAGVILGAWRRPGLPSRLRHRRFRLAP